MKNNILLYGVIAILLIYVLSGRTISNFTVPIYVPKFKPVDNECTKKYGKSYYDKNKCEDILNAEKCAADQACRLYSNNTGQFCGNYDKLVKGVNYTVITDVNAPPNRCINQK
jgi:hypothetical protein